MFKPNYSIMKRPDHFLVAITMLCACLCCSIDLIAQNTGDQTTVLTNCNIIDCTGAAPLKNMTIVIKGNTITEINSGAYQGSTGPGIEVIDVKNGYVLPGLWNMHVHLTALLPDPNNIETNETAVSAAIRAGLNAMDGLRNGFTSIQSVGERDYIDVEWKRAFDKGFFMGPRIFASGRSVSPTAGHGGDVANGADGVGKIRQAVRDRIRNGADVIKLMSVEMSQDELEAAIETTHSFGIHVTTHSSEPDIYRAVQAGVDCVEHGYGLSDKTIKLMAEKGTFYDPTIICNLSEEYIIEREDRLINLGYGEDKKISYYRMLINDADERSPETALFQRQALKKAADAGVRIVLGSDSMPIGEIGLLELEQFVLSGLSEMQALIAATRNPAEMVGMEDQLGTVQEGKLADLLIVSKNPLDNISYIREVQMVFKDGINVNLDYPNGTASFWDYYKPDNLPKPYLKKAAEKAGF